LHIRSPQLHDLVLKPFLATGALLQLARLVCLLRSFLGSTLGGRRVVGTDTATAAAAGDVAEMLPIILL